MKKKLKIGLIFEDSLDKNDGVQQYVKTLGSWLIKQGHDVKFMVGETHDAGELQSRVYSMSKNINISGNQNSMFLPMASSGSYIQSVLEKENFDVLHAMMPTNPLMGSRVIKRAKHLPIVGSFHMVGGTRLINHGATLLGWLQKRTLSHIDKFLSVSAAAKEFELQHFKIKSEISPNVVNLADFSNGKRQEFLRGRNGTLVFLGRLVERKGVRHLLEALRALHSQSKLEGVITHICGDGELRSELEDYVGAHQLSEHVIFHGFISEDEKADYLASADIAIYPSTGGEAFGIVLIEAMATGKCVVLGGDNPGYRSVLGGRNELLFNATDAEELAAKIVYFLDDKKAAKLAQLWQTNEVIQYDIAHVGPKIVNIYRNVINKSASQ